jgi:hypothetical protein
MPQYVCSPGYGLPAATSSAMMMKQLQQLMPTKQQQQMWQYHVSQYQPRLDARPHLERERVFRAGSMFTL